MKFTADILITRHNALVDLLNELGIDVKEIKAHASAEDVKDKVVIGILPLHLASLAKEIITPVIELKPEDRGKELTLEELKERFKGLRRFRVEDLGEL